MLLYLLMIFLIKCVKLRRCKLNKNVNKFVAKSVKKSGQKVGLKVGSVFFEFFKNGCAHFHGQIRQKKWAGAFLRAARVLAIFQKSVAKSIFKSGQTESIGTVSFPVFCGQIQRFLYYYY